jgi:hypothetical protein
MGIGASIQMNVEHKDFIATYKDVYPKGYCEHLIREFDRLEQSGAGSYRHQGEGADAHKKNDHQIALNMRVHTLTPFEDTAASDIFFNGLQKCYDEYTNKYSVLKDGKIHGTAMKMQRTPPGGGYHIWHAEQGNGIHANRVLVYMLYLNTLPVDAAGETEFLYQQRRVQPEENTLLIWPATFTHAHRGNLVFGDQSKYIVTGWFYYD